MVFINNDGSITSNAATPNQGSPSDDGFATKVWREALEEFDPVWGGTDKHEAAAVSVLSEAFDKVRAEERARIAAWLRKQSSTGLFFADAIKQ